MDVSVTDWKRSSNVPKRRMSPSERLKAMGEQMADSEDVRTAAETWKAKYQNHKGSIKINLKGLSKVPMTEKMSFDDLKKMQQ